MTVNFMFHEEDYSPRLKYIVPTVITRMGYPYKIISHSKAIKKQDLTIAYLSDKNLNQLPPYISLCIYNANQLDELEQAERSISLLEQAGQTIPIVGKRAIPEQFKDWRRGKNDIYYRKNRSNPWIIPIDIFLNVFFHLSRFEEKWRHFTEETSTDHSSSILFRYQNLQVPVVDVLISYLDRLIRDRIRQDKKIAVRILPWPGGEDMGVAFTHDVDITRSVRFKTRLMRMGQGYFYRLMGKSQFPSDTKKEIKEIDSQAWNLPELLSHYKNNNWTATFFFIAKIMEGTHWRYNIFSGRFRRLFKQLIANKHEIALHPSKFAFDRPRYYREEKRKLKKASGIEIMGMRQHYLRAKFPRLWVLAEKAALSYDSSLGYNFQAGFRAGTTHPFKTFDILENKPLSLVEFSVHLFEYNLPNSGNDMEESKKTISGLVEEVLKYNGLLVSLLHPSNYVHGPYKDLWEYLEKILLRNKLYVTTLSNHLKWLQFRERVRIELIYNRKNLPEIGITLPGNQNEVSFELIGDVKPVTGQKTELKTIQTGCYRILTTESKFRISLAKINRF